MSWQRPLLDPLVGQDADRIGPFTLLGRLGAGAMGRVYLGRSPAGRLVAVKTIKHEYAEDLDFRARFTQEVAAARRVSGVFTAAVVAADANAQVPWLATAYVPAPSLARLVQAGGPLPMPAVRWLAAGCAEALESIHSAGLIHRDLKPSNVLVAQDGPRVIDFGVARAVERVQLTTTHGALGTPAYMAPEQARDTSRAVAASDVFSLGSTLVYAATGHAPYQGETVMDILVQLATEPPDLVGLPEELTGIVRDCLQRDPDKRPSPASLLENLALDLHVDANNGPPELPEVALALMEAYRQPPRPVARISASAADSTFGSRVTGLQATDSQLSGFQPSGSQPSGFQTTGSLRSPSQPSGSQPSGSQPPGSQPSGSQSPGSQPTAPEPAGSPPAPPESDPPGSASSDQPEPVSGGPSRLLARLGPSARRNVSSSGRSQAGRWMPWSASGARRASTARVLLSLVALIAVMASGVLVGAWITSSRDAPAQDPGTGHGPPPERRDPPPPVSGESDRPTGPPSVQVNQPFGDVYTSFVLHGRGWPPGEQVTIGIAGGPTSPDRPFVDRAGTFNYVLNQDQEFFSGTTPPGNYLVVATASGGRRAEASFRVDP
jgi:serine/threonine protein kinase